MQSLTCYGDDEARLELLAGEIDARRVPLAVLLGVGAASTGLGAWWIAPEVDR